MKRFRDRNRSDRIVGQRLRDFCDHEEDPPLHQSSTDENELTRRKYARRGLRIGRTPVGKGVFATRLFAEDSLIGEIEGQIFEDLGHETRYSFDLEDGRTLEPIAPFRFVNHSCDPNCYFDVFDVDEHLSKSPSGVRRCILLFASYDIRAGEELTIDYNWPLCYAIPCRCKSLNCRGWVVDPMHLPCISS